MSDLAITLITVLFVLSMICERVANFIKLGMSDVKLWCTNTRVANLRLPQIDKNREKQRELHLLQLNLLCGLGVAIAFGADFNYILTNDTTNKGTPLLGHYLWKVGWINVADCLVGTLLVGVFISFGSKFWHDILDLLLQAKNLKSNLATQVTLQNNATNLAQSPLLTMPDVLAIGSGMLEQQNAQTKQIEQVPCITATVRRGVESPFPPTVFYKGNEIPIKVSFSDGATSSMATALAPGVRIGNRDTIIAGASIRPAYGSLCFPVYRQADVNYAQPLLLTCYHVVRFGGIPDPQPWERFVEGAHADVMLYYEGRVVARVVDGLRTTQLDVALAELLPNETLTPDFPNLPWHVHKARPLSEDDLQHTSVRMLGGVSGQRTGTIHEYGVQTSINYQDGQPAFKMSGLFSVATSDGKAISQPGDSGSLLLDNEDYALGLVVAGSAERTYAIPFLRILDSLDLMLKPF